MKIIWIGDEIEKGIGLTLKNGTTPREKREKGVGHTSASGIQTIGEMGTGYAKNAAPTIILVAQRASSAELSMKIVPRIVSLGCRIGIVRRVKRSILPDEKLVSNVMRRGKIDQPQHI